MGREMLNGDKVFLIMGSLESILKNDGKTKNEINKIKNLIIHCLRQNRPSYMDGFMGKI